MKELVHTLIPHDPGLGLYVAPRIPREKVRNALRDYAEDVSESEVLALYDATRIGNAKDGAVFTAERLVFENNDFSPVQDVRYADIVGVEGKRKLMGGRSITLQVNRGRATFDVTLDFSGRPGACQYVVAFLQEAMIRVPDEAAGEGGAEAEARTGDVLTDPTEVRAALDALRLRGVLSSSDLRAMLRAIGVSPDTDTGESG